MKHEITQSRKFSRPRSAFLLWSDVGSSIVVFALSFTCAEVFSVVTADINVVICTAVIKQYESLFPVNDIFR